MPGREAGFAPDKGSQLHLTKDLSKQLINENMLIFFLTSTPVSALSSLLIRQRVHLEGQRCHSSWCWQRGGGFHESLLWYSLSLCPRLLEGAITGE